MPQVEVDKVKFETVNGGKDKDDLKKCYFYPTGATAPGGELIYDLYKKESGVDTVLATGIISGSSFSFQLSGFTWTIPNPDDTSHPFSITGSGDDVTASGSWHNTDNSLTIGNDTTGESGTFTAQSGSTISPEGEAASAANA